MGSPLISAEELAARLTDVTVLDVRYRLVGPTGPTEFEAGHVPGAAYVDLDKALAAPPGEGGRHPLPQTAEFVARMRAAGVSRDRPVVVYDDWAGLAASRAWWLLRDHGHPDVRVLDGSWAAWVNAGGAVETGHPAVAPGDFAGEPGSMPVVGAENVLDVTVLLDVRAPERFRGDLEPIDPVAGHIPGALNAPIADVLTEEGLLRSPAELAALYAGLGAVPGVDVAAYCGSGVTAAQAVLALEVAGVRAALYPGSWSGWITDPSRPIATG
ncbi:MAG: sulfurtransferase [Nocardioidaceae bacterium]|nr:sulfurtransferase [Nocardioidaceae bacterium]